MSQPGHLIQTCKTIGWNWVSVTGHKVALPDLWMKETSFSVPPIDLRRVLAQGMKFYQLFLSSIACLSWWVETIPVKKVAAQYWLWRWTPNRYTVDESVGIVVTKKHHFDKSKPNVFCTITPILLCDVKPGGGKLEELIKRSLTGNWKRTGNTIVIVPL